MKKIEIAVILGAGFGKRLSPITNKIPKPLVEIGNETILEKTIKLIKKLNLKKILINTHYKRAQLKNFIEKKNFDIDIELFEEVPEILNTGGGILNMIMENKNEYFLAFNPDTLWNENYIDEILKMENHFFNSNSKNIKKSKRSKEVNTPKTLVSKINNQIKYSLYLFCILHDDIQATIPSKPVNKTKGADNPSSPNKYEDLIFRESIQLR